MKQLKEAKMRTTQFTQKFPPVLHWICETGSLHSRLHLYNYYTFLFPDREVSCDLILNVYDEDGRHVWKGTGLVEKNQSKFIEFKEVLDRSNGQDFRGSATVQLIPTEDIDEIQRYHAVGSEFYMSYYTDDGKLSIVHNERCVHFLPSKSLRPARRILIDDEYDTSVIFQNVYYGTLFRPLQSSRPSITLINSQGQSRKMRAPRIPPRGSRTVRLLDLDPNLKVFLAGQPGSAYLSGWNMYFKPLTLVTHLPSGAFNIHHT